MNAVINLELKKSIQDKGLLFWTLALPIVFTVLFISVFTSGLNEEESRPIILSIVSGYTIMFVFFIMISMTDSLLKDKNIGMVSRIASTPLSTYSYLLGKWIPYMYIIFIQIVILLLFGKFVYDVSLEQPIQLFMISVCLTFMVTGLGLALSVIVKTLNMGIAITQIVTLGGAVLSGLWMPVEMFPDFLQAISRLLPQYWAHQAFQEAMVGTLGGGQFLKILLILFGVGLAAFLVAILRYPNFLKQAKG
ncbi:ABC transporter permease [Paucisalibacillus globulus]|uniref:ABC transporter permease n=1 Tax=Paucisalibacillus globulus TaxID=351095 RepID=UPI0003FFA516|nr:ABC transporter permease [Paucisalibacillus globulus]